MTSSTDHGATHMIAQLTRILVAIASAAILSGCVKSFGEFATNQLFN